ncbi:MAG: 3-isopropylmalate dehydratase large subunit [Desulfurococcaceae archaeon]
MKPESKLFGELPLTHRILARRSGRDEVKAGDIVFAKVDKLMIHDVTGPLAVKSFKEISEKTGRAKLFDPSRVFVIIDHYAPPPTVSAANNQNLLRKFASEHGAVLYDMVGICHQVMVEGVVEPGEVVLGADSHTTMYGALSAFATGIGSTEAAYVMVTGELWLRVPEVINVFLEGRLGRFVYGKDVILEILRRIGTEGANYKALEFLGPGASSLTMDDRFTIANMSVECGAKSAIFYPDQALVEYYKEFAKDMSKVLRDEFFSPRDLSTVSREETINIDLSALEPLVAKPHSPGNVVKVKDVEGVEVTMAFIGSCTNGRLSDLKEAATILKGRRVKSGVRLIVTPASKRVYQKALREGLIDVFLEAGAVVTNPSCGPCFGGHLGVAGDEDVVISSSNRNFVGRMGSAKSLVYLANPAVVAASAVTGRITDPRDLAG